MFAQPMQQPPAGWGNAPRPQQQYYPAANPQAAVPSRIPLPPQTVANGLPPAKVRGVAPEEPPARVSLPSPEALGIRTAATTMLDWNATHARLERLQAVRFQSDRLPEGGYRVTFLLPTGASMPQQVEACGASEAAAVHLALQRAEAFASGQH
jgi:hypothetical protein